MLRTLIVDDEPMARRRIRRLLAAEADVEIVGECGDGRSAIDAIHAERPDLVFLDVQMPEADGFAVLRAIAGPPPAVIFVTAFDQYALSAFEVHALDYLLKPFSRQRFAESLAHARERFVRTTIDHPDPRLVDLLKALHQAGDKRFLTRFVVRSDGRVRLVEVDSVDWIEAADNYVVLHSGQGRHTVRDTMNRLEEELDPERFVRIHRSTIARIDRVRELVPSFHGDFVVILHDGTRLAMSRGYRQRVESLLRRRL
jgi:two-component system LytT family response regulator